MIKNYLHLNQLVTLQSAHEKDGRSLVATDLDIIDDGAIVFDDEKILWVGKTSSLPTEFLSHQSFNLSGHILTPEIVDSHTHLVFGGDRAQEYVDRLNGTPYEEIAKRGGGILFTMKETQSLTSEELFQLAVKRVETIFSYGVGTIEVKSGYGLSYDKEKELTLIIDRLKKHVSPKIQIFNTYLAAHDIPRSFSSPSSYMNEVVIPLLEELASLSIIDAVDIFHEKNYFSTENCLQLFTKAQDLGIPRKIHADELNDNSGAKLASDYGCLSADHLLKISDEGIKTLSTSKTVATLLPGTAFFLGKPLAPARKMLDAGIKVALASDYNPGSCHCDNLLLVASMAAAQLKLNQAELWCGITHNAAHSLGKRDQGVLLPGMKPRFSLFKATSLANITYHWGKNFSVNLP
jgi:imidazolonepropionase